MSDPVLVAEEIYKSFDDAGREVKVLKGINLSVQKSEMLTITGPSGSGKSTLLHILGGLSRPSSGQIRLKNSDIYNLGETGIARLRNRSIGFVFQFHHLLPDFTALENIMMPALIDNGHSGQGYIKKRAMEILERMDMADRHDHRPGELSGGEQQRVAIGRAMINNPEIILADEPTGSLDVQTAETVHRLFSDLHRNYDQTFIIVTHNESLSEKADRRVRLAGGKIE